MVIAKKLNFHDIQGSDCCFVPFQEMTIQILTSRIAF